MRILYLTFEPQSATTGVGSKIKKQIEHWQLLGHAVRHVSLRPSSEPTTEACAYPVRQARINATVSAFLARKAIARSIAEFTPDIIYMRQMMWFPGLGNALNRWPVIEEVNSDFRSETRSGLKRYLFSAVARHVRTLRGQVFVTSELRDWLGESGRIATVIANGCDIVPVRRLPDSAAPLSFIMSVSNDAVWNGLDILEQIAARMPDAVFSIAGPVQRSSPAANVHYLGQKTQAELSELYAAADCGVGTLALHRKHMTEACPLKVRDYVGHGLPAFGAYFDTDLHDAPFFLDVRNHLANLDDCVVAIRTFARQWRTTPFPLELAEMLVANRQKEIRRLDFMKEVAA